MGNIGFLMLHGQWRPYRTSRPCFNIKTVILCVWIPMLKIRRSQDRHIFNMGISILALGKVVQHQRGSILFVAIMNYANPVYGVATVCHQVRCLRWGHPSPFHTATSRLIWCKMFCVRDISNRLTWMEFINMFSMYAQSGTHRRFNRWIIAVLTYNPSVLMCVEITDAPKL